MSEENDNGVFTLASQGGIAFLGSISGKILSFLFVAVATRLVSPSEYGLFTLVLSIIMFTQGFASLNMNRAVDYFIPQFLSESNYAQANQTLQNVLLIGSTSSLFGASILYLFRGQVAQFFNEPQIIAVIPYLVLLIPLQTILKILISSFNSIKKVKYRVVANDLINPTIRIVGTAGLVIMGLSVNALVGGYLLGVTIAILFGIFFLLYEVDWIIGAKSESVSNRSLLTYSFPLVLAGVIYSLVGQIDYFVIGYFSGSAEVGKYRVAYLLSSNLLIVLTSIASVFKPMVAENQSDSAILEMHYQLATRWVTILTLPIAVTLMLAPDIYLSLLFTQEYTVAATTVVILVLGYLFNAAVGPEGMLLEGLGHTRLTLINTLVLVGINMVLDIILVPRYGILGAGIATGLALTVAGLVGVVEIYYLRSLTPISKKLPRAWLAIVPSCTLGWLVVSLNLGSMLTALVLPVIVTCCYLLGLRATNSFSEYDRNIASKVADNLGNSLLSRIIPPSK